MESVQTAREKVERGILAILNEIATRHLEYFKSELLEKEWRKVYDTSGAENALTKLFFEGSTSDRGGGLDVSPLRLIC